MCMNEQNKEYSNVRDLRSNWSRKLVSVCDEAIQQPLVRRKCTPPPLISLYVRMSQRDPRGRKSVAQCSATYCRTPLRASLATRHNEVVNACHIRADNTMEMITILATGGGSVGDEDHTIEPSLVGRCRSVRDARPGDRPDRQGTWC